jgi:serine/threonine-protein kinase RsbW
MAFTSNTIELVLGSSLEYLGLVETVTDSITALMGFDQEAAYWVNMAVRESSINAIRHGNGLDPQKKVTILFLVSPKELTIRISDQGEGFDPQSLPDPLALENLLKPSGRGIFYIRSFMDQVDFERKANGGMQIQMIKHLVPKQTN